jgi:hypothetical protein
VPALEQAPVPLQLVAGVATPAVQLPAWQLVEVEG